MTEIQIIIIENLKVRTKASERSLLTYETCKRCGKPTGTEFGLKTSEILQQGFQFQIEEEKKG